MPNPVVVQVLDLVAANANDSMVDCTIPGAGGNWGMCASMLMMLQDDTKATFVKSTLVNVVRERNLARDESDSHWALFLCFTCPSSQLLLFVRALHGLWAVHLPGDLLGRRGTKQCLCRMSPVAKVSLAVRQIWRMHCRASLPLWEPASCGRYNAGCPYLLGGAALSHSTLYIRHHYKGQTPWRQGGLLLGIQLLVCSGT